MLLNNLFAKFLLSLKRIVRKQIQVLKYDDKNYIIMTKQKENSFRCQYQKGKICISRVIRHSEIITTEEILIALCELALEVEKQINRRTGGRVALKVLSIHEDFIKAVDNIQQGNGSSKSYFLDRKNKKKINRTERIDLEFIGEIGIDDKNHILSEYIEKYRENKSWD